NYKQNSTTGLLQGLASHIQQITKGKSNHRRTRPKTPSIYDQTETEYNYDNLVDEIVRKYDIRIKLNPPIKNMSVNQITLLNRANKHNDRNSPEKDQTSTNNLLHRINIKFCSNCLEKRHKSPQVHTNNDCGHLHPELKR
ncbi:hypothetical protein E3Q17_04457, partial [Wallemia mellicola]